MKILLAAINAKYIHSNPAIHSLRAAALQEFRLGIPPEETPADAVSKEAIRTGDPCMEAAFGPREMILPLIETGEYTINHTIEAVRADIYRRRPNVLCFSCYIWNIRYVRELVGDLHRLLPETEIWLGGPEVSSHPEKLLAGLPEVRGIMVGPGEATFAELVKRWAARGSQGDLRGIPGLVYREPGYDQTAGLCPETDRRIHSTGAPRIMPLSQIPFWYTEWEQSGSPTVTCGEPEGGSRSAERTDRIPGFENRIIYYESSRGCPFRCSYCLSSIDKHLEFRDPEKVKRELQFFLDRGVPQVKFIDRTFNCREDHALAIWQYIHTHDNGVTNFHFEIAADLLTEAELEVLGKMRPGQIQLEIGVQSVNPATLREIRRTMDLTVLSDRVTRIRGLGNIHQHLDLIAGLPEEDYASFGRSFDRVYSMKPDQLQLGFLKVLPGTAMEEMAEEYGLLSTAEAPYEVLSTRWLSYSDVLRLKGIEDAVETYYNSGQFRHTLEALVRLTGSPFLFYEKLAAFREASGESGIQSSRVRRYEVLLAFARQEDPEGENRYRELLTRDCYLRENLRNRPSFAPEQREEDRQLWKDLLRRAACDASEVPHFPEGCEGMGYREMMHQLHVEFFRETDPAGEAALPPEPVPEGENSLPREPFLVIFDYRHRDPLTNNASEVILTCEEAESCARRGES